jgi:acyl-CoA synthetase (AMP-forming)/AMP-acid ligase II
MSSTVADARTFWELLERRVAETPDAPMLIQEADRLPGADRVLSFREVRDRAERIAAGLHQQYGVGDGTPVAWQLPTRVETVLVSLALARLGAVQTPIIAIYRGAEVARILQESAPALYLVPGVWRGFDYVAFAEKAAAGTAEPPRVLVAYHEAELPQGDPALLPPPPRGDLSDERAPIRWVYYTSGITAAPKGARHTDRTLIAGGVGLADALRMGPQDVGSIAFPYAHIGGPDYLVTMLVHGFPALLVEVFALPDALPAYRRNGVTMAGGSTAFYAAFLAEQRTLPAGERLLPSLRLISGGGAPRPPEMYREVLEELGCVLAHGYGMTEVPAICMGSPTDTAEQLAYTEGHPVTGVEVRVVLPGGAGGAGGSGAGGSGAGGGGAGGGGGFDLGADAEAAVGEGEDVGGGFAGHDPGGQGGVVYAAVVAADDQGDAAAGEGVQGGQGGQHVRGQAVVDEGDAAGRADRGEPARQRLVAGRRRAQRGGIGGARDAEGDQAAAGDERVAAVMPAGQAERVHPVRAGVVVLADPLDPGAEQRGALAEQGAVAVGHGEFGAGLGARGQLVPVVLLHSPVPVEMVRVQRGDRDHGRRDRQVGGLVAGHLDHPVVEVARVARVVGHGADVAADHAPVAQPGQEVPGERGGGALALGTGHAQDAPQVRLGEPQAQAAHHRDARRGQPGHLGPVPGQARRLHHHVAALEGGQAAVAGGEHRAPVHRTGRPVVDQDRLAPQRQQLVQVGVALPAQAPDPHLSAGQVRPGKLGSRHR